MQVNGEKFVLQESQVLLDFLQQKGYEISRIAVEINGVIVPKKDYATYRLHDEDALEIVAFMGGG